MHGKGKQINSRFLQDNVIFTAIQWLQNPHCLAAVTIPSSKAMQQTGQVLLSGHMILLCFESSSTCFKKL